MVSEELLETEAGPTGRSLLLEVDTPPTGLARGLQEPRVFYWETCSNNGALSPGRAGGRWQVRTWEHRGCSVMSPWH